ncbi:very low-density lipoprotein receptor-like isoform X1 [Asterias rubens]|uniref:very low-density lipoprotein receptor-like isoform X1 n=1 Tax=Asterias rubens TaxID=7604 RepID=UPI0014554502|nr:very low-density lipoprotein receptor-like isoform X1 [Asterias rubens]
MRNFTTKPCALSLAYLCLVLCICSGVQGIWFGRPGDSWMRSKVIWQRPQNEEMDGPAPADRGRYPSPGDEPQEALYSWSAEEEDDKRDGVSSKILFNLIRGKGRSSTTKRSAECQTDEFRCGDGSCIPSELECDGQQDCQLGSDELVCKFPMGNDVPPKHDSTLGASVGNRQHDRMNQECLHKLITGLRIAGPFTRSYNCPVGYMKCATIQRQCYDERYACDGLIDCWDGSDEADCAIIPCPAEGYIKCDNQWQCFDTTRTCDGQVDCNDGSDERNCASKPCASDHVKCADKKQCYPAIYTCDAVIDCVDGSDEQNCSTYQCLTGFKKCANNQQCYNQSQQCDGINQCVDGSDEVDCRNNAEVNSSSMTSSTWQCKHDLCEDGTKCYLWHLRCDGVPACDDGSDEWGCASSSCPPRKVKCQDRQQCIWEEWLCDGEVQCKDGSEERGCTAYVPQFDYQGWISDVTDALNSPIEVTSQNPRGETFESNA